MPAAGTPDSLTLHHTEEGVRFGIWGSPPARPAPTLFILAGTIEDTLTRPAFRQAGNELANEGWLCVSIDLPDHGAERKDGEPGGLAAWRLRAERGEDFVGETAVRLQCVLNHLIGAGWTDPSRVVASGTSRGGFMALHFAAREPRVRMAVTFAPVTDLEALSEFAGLETHPFVRGLAVSGQAASLAGRPVWLVIGDRDERVGTDRTIALARHGCVPDGNKGLKNSEMR